MERYDERDNMFSRMALKKGSPEYKEYYKENPEKKEIDDKLRQMPELMGEGTSTFDPLNSPMGVSVFRFLADIKGFAAGRSNKERIKVEPGVMTKKLKGYASYHGADLVGITEINPELYYSHRGRDQHFGEQVNNFHKYAIVFAVEMDKEMVARAPRLEEGIETTKGYLKAGIIGMVLSYYLRELGYEARNHLDGNYLLIAPPLAEKAGLGEIGRLGLLVTEEYGPRVRLGVVTTDMELIPDEKGDFGLKQFCKICKKCAEYCPGEAISDRADFSEKDLQRWPINQEKCYKIWRQIGTDCGVCLSVCPFSSNVKKELVDNMKGNGPVMKQILREHEEDFSLLPLDNESPDWLKVGREGWKEDGRRG